MLKVNSLFGPVEIGTSGENIFEGSSVNKNKKRTKQNKKK